MTNAITSAENSGLISKRQKLPSWVIFLALLSEYMNPQNIAKLKMDAICTAWTLEIKIITKITKTAANMALLSKCSLFFLLIKRIFWQRSSQVMKTVAGRSSTI